MTKEDLFRKLTSRKFWAALGKTHNSKTWISLIDNNVWEPGMYGCSEVTE